MQICTFALLPFIYRLQTFLGNSADQYIRLAHIFCPFQMRLVMVTHGDGAVSRGGWGVGVKHNA